MSDVTTDLQAELVRSIETGESGQGKAFEFKRPRGRTAEEGLTLPELVFQALGAAYGEGIKVGLNGGSVPSEGEYATLLDIGHQLLAHVADQVRG